MEKDDSRDREETLVDELRVEGVNAKGFGTVPKAVMKDQRLSIAAKALYAYFCSYAGSGGRAFPGRTIILHDLQISKDYYYKILGQLKDFDYVRVYQEQKKGKYGRNIYTLVNCPAVSGQSSSPCPATQDTVEEPCPVPPDTVRQDTNINKSIKDIDLSIHPTVDTEWMDRMDRYSFLVKENIEYDMLMSYEPQFSKLAESIYMLMMDVLCGEEKTFKVNGAVMDAQAVRQRFLELRHNDISSVINGITALGEPVRNVRNYLLTALYNARATSETHWTSQINNMVRLNRERR